MGIGTGSLKAMFDLITENGKISRTELTKRLGISSVSVGYAADILCDSGLIRKEKDSLSKSSPGRRTDVFAPSPDAVCLLINACDGSVSFSLTPLTNTPAERFSLPFIYTMDFGSNLAVALSEIKDLLKSRRLAPVYTAIALPGKLSDDGRLIGTTVQDYLGDSILEIISTHGVNVDLITSGVEAVSSFLGARDESAKRAMYVSVCETVWGCINGEQYIDWGSIPIDKGYSLSYAEALSCCCDPGTLAVYTSRFINTLRAAFSVDNIYISSTVLSEDIIEQLGADVHGAYDVPPIIHGLFNMAKEGLFKKYIK